MEEDEINAFLSDEMLNYEIFPFIGLTGHYFSTPPLTCIEDPSQGNPVPRFQHYANLQPIRM